LQPQDAYGLYEEEAVIDFDLESFKNEKGELDAEKIAIGQPITVEDANGRPYHGLIVDMEDNTVVIDFNHAMAGLTLHFKGEIISVRDAEGSELVNGFLHSS
jgi:FKBP-type peptidyl-prolyl cis-trans isomerase SlyD